jgi:acetyl-CoA acetyltransferase
MQLHAEASENALRDAGMDKLQIDGIASAGINPLDVADYLGINPTWLDGTDVGGASPIFHVRHAAAAIAAGLCTTVLVTHGESGRSGIGMTEWAPPRQSHMEQFETPYGVNGAATLFPLGLLRYLRDTGTTIEQLAMVPVVQRQWSSRNSRAKMRDLISVEDVLASPLIAYPIHLLMCCLVTDGGGALVLQSAEHAARVGHARPLVHVIGAGEAVESSLVAGLEDPTRSRAMRQSSAAAFAEAGVKREDIDHVMIYDAFAHVPLFGLEELQFVGRGEAGAFVADGHTAPGGSLPMNTNGGGLSYTHTGMYGMFAIQESVRQLRREAEAQVDDVRLSLVQAVGGMFMSSGCLILADEDVAAATKPRLDQLPPQGGTA